MATRLPDDDNHSRRPVVRRPTTDRLGGLGEFSGLALLGLVGVLLGALPFLVLAALVETRWEPLAKLDMATSDGLNTLVAASPLTVSVLEIITELGGGAPANMVMGVAVVCLLVRRQPRLAAYLAVTGIGLAVLVWATKALVGRARPVVALPVVELPTNPSFPSGHAMTAIVTWGAITALILPLVRARHRRRLVIAAVALVVLVGFTRIALGVHFLTDVLAGWALGAAWLAVTAAAFRHWLADRHEQVSNVGLGEPPVPTLRPRTLQERALPDGRHTLLRIIGAAVAILAGLVAVGFLITGPLADTAIGRWDSQLVQGAVALRSPQLTDVVLAVDRLSGAWGIITALWMIAAVSLAQRGSWRPATLVLLAVVGELFIYISSSHIVGRARPEVADLTSGLPQAASFPSGHVAAVTAVYGSLCLIVLVYGRGWWRTIVVVAAATLVAATMAARVYLAAHYPTDTMAGLVMALVWLWVLHRYLLAPSDGPPKMHDWRGGVAPGTS